jgi:hypothetical protein
VRCAQILNIGAHRTVKIDIAWKKMALPKLSDSFTHMFRKSF